MPIVHQEDWVEIDKDPDIECEGESDEGNDVAAPRNGTDPCGHEIVNEDLMKEVAKVEDHEKSDQPGDDPGLHETDLPQ